MYIRAKPSLAVVLAVFRRCRVDSALIGAAGRGDGFQGRVSFCRASACRLSSSVGEEWTTAKVRETFVSYFEGKGHVRVPSSPVAPLADPTLLFTNAGMNQFKPIFLGQVPPGSPYANLTLAVNSQKCIRAGGKHNDLDDVGRDTYHHSFFEMLGSWSFGGYFKRQAIAYAFDLLTNVYTLDHTRIYATYYGGDDGDSLPDLEARDYWLRHLPRERVIACGAKDNFWEMGETGPCGPCSEIHYDRIGNRDASTLVNADDPDVIEIWNIVFIQYNRKNAQQLSPLPNKHIDTGMGLERLVSILQRKTSNYDIDAFQPIFAAIQSHSKVGPYTGLLWNDDVTLKDTAYRAVADHVRTLSFAIADGVLPNNEGRGYVLRRVLRRAARYGLQILKAEPGFLSKLIPVVVDTFGDAYPELVKNQDTIIDIVREEEQSFSAMLDRGILFFSDLRNELSDDKIVPGDKAFFMYDTLGFPIDLTQQMAQEAGLTVDTEKFTREMEAQKQRSRDARKAAKKGTQLELIAEHTSWLAKNGVSATNDSFKYKWDVQTAATVKAMFAEKGFFSSSEVAEVGAEVGLILDNSSFYAEAGGQESDLGRIAILPQSDKAAGGEFLVTDVQSYGQYLLHNGVVVKGEIRVGAQVNCLVDYERRRDVAPNHSMTHILNAALRKILGEGVDQRGSFCNDEKLRFDFSHKKAMNIEQLRATEQYCQRVIANGEAATFKVMPLEEAKVMKGIRAVFGEVYPDPVRVVSFGTSVEFCGGTHISNTAEAEAFAIVEETAVAKGIRRITAVTKDAAIEAIAEGTKLDAVVTETEAMSLDTPGLDKIAGNLRKELDGSRAPAVGKSELRARIEILQRKAAEQKKRLFAGRMDKCLNFVKERVSMAAAEGKKSLVLNVDIGADAKAAQKVMNAAKERAPHMAFLGISREDDIGGVGGNYKVFVFARVPDSMINDAGFKADDWVRASLDVVGGRGGGRADSAQGQVVIVSPCSIPMDTIVVAANSFAEKKTGAIV